MLAEHALTGVLRLSAPRRTGWSAPLAALQGQY